ncbi:MAG: DNA polymerase/3'-5' exonuclease PolX [Gemmatimonadetes bacterium]|nr:DNA polymerase/3'-5' exonuclease PolX [Gemmatimonadota bacterium]
MTNHEIARALSGIADHLEIRQENRFRIRAYRNAARAVREQTRPLDEMVRAGADLTSLPGIGKDIARRITELVNTGRTERLEALEREIPGTVIQLMDLDGIGPKRARELHDRLGVNTLQDLERAIESGDLLAVPGFGEKTVERLRRTMAEHRSRGTRTRLSEADRHVLALIEWMEAAPGIERVEAAGSWRRRVDTVGDIDLLAIAADPTPVMAHFAAFPRFERVTAAGSTRGTAFLESGFQVDLRIVAREAYGAALHYFTGSKAHNVAVRQLGVRRGLRISEYGVFRVDGETDERIGGEHERDVFAAVGMEWVPPELREDRGEVDAARKGRLPDLIDVAHLRGDLHMHSTWSDGRESIETMARACAERGYRYMAIADHSRSTAIANGLAPDRLEEQWLEIDAVRERVPEIRILRSMEVDILPDGTLDLPDSHLERLDLVIVSVHGQMRMPARPMTDRVIRALQHPCVDILGHPTGRRLLERPPFEIDMEAVLRAAAELDVAVEINSLPPRLDLNDLHARRARELGVRIAIDTDAHSLRELANIAYGVGQARRGWVERDGVINALDADAFERWRARRRPERAHGLYRGRATAVADPRATH